MCGVMSRIRVNVRGRDTGELLSHGRLVLPSLCAPELPEAGFYPGNPSETSAAAIIRLMLAQGRRRIGIRTARENDSVLVEISDDGPVGTEGDRDRVFAAFFTTKVVGKGTDIGSDISHRIVVEQHGGDICFTSEPGTAASRNACR
jgi:Histidine kinase-, DNA gyrase B-, and HSP90-like ATPase